MDDDVIDVASANDLIDHVLELGAVFGAGALAPVGVLGNDGGAEFAGAPQAGLALRLDRVAVVGVKVGLGLALGRDPQINHRALAQCGIGTGAHPRLPIGASSPMSARRIAIASAETP